LLTIARIAALTGLGRQHITRLLYDAAAEAGPGGGRRATRQAAQGSWPGEVMAHLSRDDESAASRLRPPTGRGPSEVELLTALYADPRVRQALDKHGVPLVTSAGPPWKRFPAPRPLTADLVSDLYDGCGLSLHHIELLTGRPAAAAGAILRAKGIQLRPPGGPSPFTDRWRRGQAE
jgi:hypothetical protein